MQITEIKDQRKIFSIDIYFFNFTLKILDHVSLNKANVTY